MLATQFSFTELSRINLHCQMDNKYGGPFNNNIFNCYDENSRIWYQFSARNTKVYKFCRLIFFSFYNILQPNLIWHFY